MNTTPPPASAPATVSPCLAAYACPACNARSHAELVGLPASASPEQIAARLRFVTCPRCGQRNPAAHAGDDGWVRHARVIMLGIAGFLGAATWLFPVPGAALTGAALIVPNVVGYVLRRRAGAPGGIGGLLTALHFGVALVLAAYFWPRAAFVGAMAAFLVPLAQREAAERAAWEKGGSGVRWLPAGEGAGAPSDPSPG